MKIRAFTKSLACALAIVPFLRSSSDQELAASLRAFVDSGSIPCVTTLGALQVWLIFTWPLTAGRMAEIHTLLESRRGKIDMQGGGIG